MQQNKIVIIGAGMVGSATLFSLSTLGLASEIVVIDVNEEKAKGEVLDVSHTTSYTYNPNTKIRAGNYSDCKDAKIIVITAGPSVTDPSADRISLASKNVAIIKNIMKDITKFTKDAIIILVTNPLDIATYTAWKCSGYPKEKIIGTGTLLDSARFRRIIAKKLDIDAKNVHGYILGEHGSTAFATWSLVDIAGVPLDKYIKLMNLDMEIDKDAIVDKTRTIGFDILKKKGYTNFGIAGTVQRLVKALLLNEKSILPLSIVLDGEYGLHDVALSIPCIVSSNGIEKTIPIPLPEDEMNNLLHSASFLKEVLSNLEI